MVDTSQRLIEKQQGGHRGCLNRYCGYDAESLSDSNCSRDNLWKQSSAESKHLAGLRSEMRCDICMLVKPPDEFSKNSRRNGEYVRRCVAWTEIQEPSLTPGPLETGHISPEEEQQRTLRQRFVMSQDFFPDDDDDLVPQFLSRADDASSTRSIVLPPHLRSKYKAVSEAASCTSSTAGDVSLPTTLLESDSDTASI
ncbi:hypothetical protein ARSEF4850_009716, partial [Beauveria asiatica]